jgi:hypothetical protein
VSHHHIRSLALVREELEAARAATAYVEERWTGLHDLHETPVSYAHLERTIRNLERTYLIRLFSEFEGILRRHLEAGQPQRQVPRNVEDVINRAARIRRIQDEVREGAHQVRNYRNSLVHGGHDAPALAFSQALARLNRFLAPLPDA